MTLNPDDAAALDEIAAMCQADVADLTDNAELIEALGEVGASHQAEIADLTDD